MNDSAEVHGTPEMIDQSTRKRQRRPSAIVQFKVDCRSDEQAALTTRHDKKRPTLRFSEMIRNDWTTFSRERAHEFDDVEYIVYAPWKQLCLSQSELERFGVNIKAVSDEADNTLKSRKSSWCATIHAVPLLQVPSEWCS